MTRNLRGFSAITCSTPKGFYDYGIKRGLTTPEAFRLTIAGRQQIAKALVNGGMSRRQVAKACAQRLASGAGIKPGEALPASRSMPGDVPCPSTCPAASCPGRRGPMGCFGIGN
jgi:hypothetical protein